jgi:glycosyltransferase involved in cell wall biosynthesis
MVGIWDVVSLVTALVVEGSGPLKNWRILTLTKYGSLGASSRMRSLQYLPWFDAYGLKSSVQTMLNDHQLADRYQSGHYDVVDLLFAYGARIKALMSRRYFDVVWIEKEALQWLPLWIELALLRGTPFVLDYDDAVFHNYDKHRFAFVRFLYGRRLDGLMAKAALVVAGNSYLAQRALLAGARRVEIIPTVIDLNRYTLTKTRKASAIDNMTRIVWIGSPATVHYLDQVAEALRLLAKRHTFVLRVIGGGQVDMPGVPVEFVQWAENSEVDNISCCDVGIMPLQDTLWERGKCGYKLIQYMACALPVVASPIGVNTEIVTEGENGYLAKTTAEWVVALDALLSDEALRRQMGNAGRATVEDRYCIQKTGPRMAELLKEAAQGV